MSRYELTIGGVAYSVDVLSVSGNVATVNVNGVQHQVQIAGPPVGSPARGPAPAAAPVAPAPPPAAAAAPATAPSPAPLGAAASNVKGEVVPAPMPGNIVNILVNVGDKVAAGATLLIMEAMKMENEINAPAGGTVAAIHVAKGETVRVNQPLVTLAP